MVGIFKKRYPFNLFVLDFDKKYSHVIPYIRKSNELCGVRHEGINRLKYDTVKNVIPKLINEGNLEKALQVALNEQKMTKFGKEVRLREVLKADNYRKLEFLLWIQNEYKKLKILEEKMLSSEPDKDWTNAGVSKLEILGDFYMIDTLAVKYSKTHEEITSWTYGRIFDIRLKDKLEREVNDEYNRIKRNRAKRK